MSSPYKVYLCQSLFLPCLRALKIVSLKIISPEAQGQASAWTKSSESRRGGRPRLSNSGSSPNAMRAAGIKAVKVRTQEVPRSVLHTSESDGNDKQDTTRERNRQAASRCRNKKRRVNGDLQVQEAAINNINMYLKHEVVMLQSEILSLKNMVLQHSGCGCRLIDKYISQAARNLVQVDLNIKPSLPGEAAPLMEADVHVSELPWQNSDSEQCYVDWARLDGNSQANTPLLSSEGIVLGLMDGKCNMA
ncbi:bZIP transcription factor [Colletotrichum nymphaeae SA-01]|uniref:BZIP transcription factor n=1 Tax=Colletotrichum nymphaeae SA-01 TaxID=1460502 RepID=A0A135RW27_9PEZI|nr:bZIP transcription factor [Colletotrichum nymphaeae SA-01]